MQIKMLCGWCVQNSHALFVFVDVVAHFSKPKKVAYREETSPPRSILSKEILSISLKKRAKET